MRSSQASSITDQSTLKRGVCVLLIDCIINELSPITEVDAKWKDGEEEEEEEVKLHNDKDKR